MDELTDDYKRRFDRLRFSWNQSKAKINLNKHGVSFEEAATVFGNTVQRRYDLEHGPQAREIVTGFSFKMRLLMVVIFEYEKDQIRLISARRATRAEGLRFFTES